MTEDIITLQLDEDLEYRTIQWRLREGEWEAWSLEEQKRLPHLYSVNLNQVFANIQQLLNRELSPHYLETRD